MRGKFEKVLETPDVTVVKSTKLHPSIMKLPTFLPRFLALLPLCASSLTAQEKKGELTVFVAKKIITMEPALPEATAVAVADGQIVSVGSLDSLQGWLRERGGKIDNTFKDKVLMPGFIDPHIHPSLPAVLSQFAFIAPDDWTLPTGEFPVALNPGKLDPTSRGDRQDSQKKAIKRNEEIAESFHDRTMGWSQFPTEIEGT